MPLWWFPGTGVRTTALKPLPALYKDMGSGVLEYGEESVANHCFHVHTALAVVILNLIEAEYSEHAG